MIGEMMKSLVINIVEPHVVDEQVEEATNCEEDQEEPEDLDHLCVVHLVCEYQKAARRDHKIPENSRENVELA